MLKKGLSTAYLPCLLLFWCLWVSIAHADPRFVILLDKNTALPTLDGKIQQALPQLWERILPINTQVNPPLVSQPRSLLRGIQMGRKLITVELNDDAVWALLTQQGIPMLRKTPHIRLHITLLNIEDKPMLHSQRLLAEEAATLARRWGIVLDDSASEMNMAFTWLDEKQVALHITGSALLSEVHENKTIQGDSFSFLQKWLRNDLLQLRDTLAAVEVVTPTIPFIKVKSNASRDNYADEASDEAHGFSNETSMDGTLLVIRKAMTLSQQLLFEQAMAKEQRVKALLPLSFSSDQQRYLLQLKTGTDLWLKAWFSEHGMHAIKQEQGWLIR